MTGAATRVIGEDQRDPLDTPRVAAISRLSAIDTVRARITLAITLGLLVAGDRLPPADEMAESFGVSVTSVNRGLAVLQDEGVVVRRAGRYGGTYVGSPEAAGQHGMDAPVQSFLDDDSHVHTLIDERAVLEAGFAALAAAARSTDDLRELTHLAERMAETESWAEFRNLDRAFHRRVVEAARTPRAEAQVARVNAALDPYFLPYSMGLLRSSNQEHHDIVAALAAGDAGAAAALTAAHVQELHHSMYVGLTNAG
ncbi:FadR/GntR family transcriptional regulator [Leucobacter japonicus]|uniref:FadR/GntR family transcriptional regulator n=1 Tax=Leucobacter japonicus TaxID=1461259 RepID=UPI0006A7C9FD|nr:FCD domain-containing protein [Leucobacter japonicus]